MKFDLQTACKMSDRPGIQTVALLCLRRPPGVQFEVSCWVVLGLGHVVTHCLWSPPWCQRCRSFGRNSAVTVPAGLYSVVDLLFAGAVGSGSEDKKIYISVVKVNVTTDEGVLEVEGW